MPAWKDLICGHNRKREKRRKPFQWRICASLAERRSKTSPPRPTSDDRFFLQKRSAIGMASSSTLVKELREKTGAGIMDCQNALKESGQDVEKAIEHLRKKGLATA